MLVEDALNLLDEMFDSSISLPFSGGRCVIDVSRARDIIDDIRINMPAEFQQAEGVLVARDKIVSAARQEAEEIVRKAEERARVLLAKDEAVKGAQQKANQIMQTAQIQSKEMRAATHKFADNMLRQSEESMLRSLEDIKKTRKAIRTNTKSFNE